MSQGTCPLDSFEATNAYDEKIEAQLPENKSQGDRFFDSLVSQGTCPPDSFEATSAYYEKTEAQLPENKSQGDRFFDSLGESRDLSL